MMWLVGVGPFLLVHSANRGARGLDRRLAVYIQHQFEHTVWVGDGTWNLQEAALHGSSHYALPSLLALVHCQYRIHHIHHLCSTSAIVKGDAAA